MVQFVSKWLSGACRCSLLFVFQMHYLPPHIMMTIFRHCPFPSFLPQKMKDPSGCFKSERFGSKVATYLVLLKAALIWWWTAAKCSPSQNTSFRCVVLFSNILTVFNKKKLSNTEFWPSNTETPRLTRFRLARNSLQHGFGLGTKKFT